MQRAAYAEGCLATHSSFLPVRGPTSDTRVQLSCVWARQWVQGRKEEVFICIGFEARQLPFFLGCGCQEMLYLGTNVPRAHPCTHVCMPWLSPTRAFRLDAHPELRGTASPVQHEVPAAPWLRFGVDRNVVNVSVRVGLPPYRKPLEGMCNVK